VAGDEDETATQREGLLDLIPSLYYGSRDDRGRVEPGQSQHRRGFTPKMLVGSKPRILDPGLTLVRESDSQILIDGLTPDSQPMNRTADSRTE
jgi:hypothetical protein